MYEYFDKLRADGWTEAGAISECARSFGGGNPASEGDVREKVGRYAERTRSTPTDASESDREDDAA
jgi:hypothetical protein